MSRKLTRKQGIWLYASRSSVLVDDHLFKERKKYMDAVNLRLTGGPILYLVAIFLSIVTDITWIAIGV
jgi:hypothetical protein